jgi:hypothetical protein
MKWNVNKRERERDRERGRERDLEKSSHGRVTGLVIT